MSDYEIPKEVDDWLSDTARYNRIHVFGHFKEISEIHQGKIESLLKTLNKLYDENEDFQCEEYYKAQNEAQRSSYIAIVFSVMYIEASIYNFAAIYLGDQYVTKNLDRLSLLSKITVVVRLVTGKDISVETQAYENLKRLLKYRNSLVHSKSRPLMDADAMYKYQEKNEIGKSCY